MGKKDLRFKGLRFTVYGLRFTVYGLRFTVYGLRFTVYSYTVILVRIILDAVLSLATETLCAV